MSPGWAVEGVTIVMPKSAFAKKGNKKAIKKTKESLRNAVLKVDILIMGKGFYCEYNFMVQISKQHFGRTSTKKGVCKMAFLKKVRERAYFKGFKA